MAAGTVIDALSDPARRQIVMLLGGGPKRAGELAAEVGMSAPAMSRHLRVLLAAAVIAVAIAIFSVMKTIQSQQGRDMGPLGGGSIQGTGLKGQMTPGGQSDLSQKGGASGQ